MTRAATTHMPAFMGVPTIKIFSGVVNVNVWHVGGPNAPVPCVPCHLGKLQDCSYGRLCLTSISDDDVVVSAPPLLRPSNFQDTCHEVRKVAPPENVAGDAGPMGRFDVKSFDRLRRFKDVVSHSMGDVRAQG